MLVKMAVGIVVGIGQILATYVGGFIYAVFGLNVIFHDPVYPEWFMGVGLAAASFLFFSYLFYVNVTVPMNIERPRGA